MYVANVLFEDEEVTDIEREYLEKYAAYLEEIPATKEEEIEDLYEKAVKGDEKAQARLATIYMKLVVKAVKEMKQTEVFIGDLIQAGNIGVILGLEKITDTKTAHKVIMEQVRKSIGEEIC